MAVMAFAALGAWLAPTGYAAAGWMIGSAIGNMLFPSTPDQNVQGPRFGDMKVQSSTYGTMIPIVRGHMRLAGNVIWQTPRREIAHTTTQGGKGGGEVTSTTYTYLIDQAISICDCPAGPMTGVELIWANGELVFDASVTASTEANIASALGARSIRVYPGSATQPRDPLMVAHLGVDDTPGYLNEMYAVLEDWDITRWNGQPPSLEFKVIDAGALADLAVPTTATLGPVTGGPPGGVLGRNGNVWHGPDSADRAVRSNVYAGAYQAYHLAPTFRFKPTGTTLDGEAFASEIFGTVLGILHEDGGQTEYQGSVASMGSNGIIAESRTVLWAMGDSVAGDRTYRVTLDLDDNTYTATILPSWRGGQWFIGAARIPGRIYAQEGDAFGQPPWMGYWDTRTVTWVRLWNPGFLWGATLLASTGYIWTRSTSAPGTSVEKRDSEGNLIATITLPEVGAWVCYEDREGLIWAIGPRAYQIHPVTHAILARSVTFTQAFLGFTEDNRPVVHGVSGSDYVLRTIERLPRITPSAVPVSALVAQICEMCGLAPAEYDVTQLTDTLDGYGLARLGSGRAAIEPLMAAYAFDAVESSGKIRFVKRGAVSPITVIPEADLAAHAADDTPGAPTSAATATQTELPAKLTVNYFDIAAHYEINAQRAMRQVTRSQHVVSIDMPLAFSADRAARIAHMAQDIAWASARTVQWITTRKYAYLEPTDLVDLPGHGLVRIESKYESGAIIQWEGVAEDPALYAQTVAGSTYQNTLPEVAGLGVTALRLLDLPLLRDEDDGPGWYAALAGYSDAWRAAVLYKSIDNGASYDRTEYTFNTQTVLGTALSALATFLGGYVIDASSTVDVQINSGALASISDAQLLAGGNAILLGGELLHFGTAVQLATRRYRLSRFLRGMRGTDAAMSTHQVGDSFVLLSSAGMRRIQSTTAEIGVERLYKAPAAGASLDQAAAVPFTSQAVGLKPLSPVHLAAGRNAASDAVIKWTPRTRISGEWRSAADAPVGEASTQFEVEVWNSTFTTLLYTKTGLATPTWTYPATGTDSQTTHFGAPQALGSIRVRVYQISAVVGRGFYRQGAV